MMGHMGLKNFQFQAQWTYSLGSLGQFQAGSGLLQLRKACQLCTS